MSSTFPKCSFPNCEANKRCIPGLKYYSLEKQDSGTAKWLVLVDRDVRSTIFCERHYPNSETSDSIFTNPDHVPASFVEVESTSSPTPSSSTHRQHDNPTKNKKIMTFNSRDIKIKIPPSNIPRLLILTNVHPSVEAELIKDPVTVSGTSDNTKCQEVNEYPRMTVDVLDSPTEIIEPKNFSTKEQLRSPSPLLASLFGTNFPPRVNKETQTVKSQVTSNADYRSCEAIPLISRKPDPRPDGNTNLSRAADTENEYGFIGGTSPSTSKLKYNRNARTDIRLTISDEDNRRYFNSLAEPNLKRIIPTIAHINTPQAVIDCDHVYCDNHESDPEQRDNTDINATALDLHRPIVTQSGGDANQGYDEVTKEVTSELSDPCLMRINDPSTSTVDEETGFLQVTKRIKQEDASKEVESSLERKAYGISNVPWRSPSETEDEREKTKADDDNDEITEARDTTDPRKRKASNNDYDPWKLRFNKREGEREKTEAYDDHDLNHDDDQKVLI